MLGRTAQVEASHSILTRHLFFASLEFHLTQEAQMPAVFVNLPVTDLERAKAFYTAVGFTINPRFSDHNAACVVVEHGHSYFMIQTREFFQTMTDLPIGDPALNPSAATTIFLESREAVDAAVAAGVAAG